jgi:hypothetical protein
MLALWVLGFGWIAAVFVAAFEARGSGFDVSIQQAVFAFAGLHLIMLAGADLERRRDPDSLLLVLWLCGVFFFATFTNWTTNARSILPAIPVVGILLIRRLETVEALRPKLVFAGIAPGLLLAIVVTRADADWAGSVRDAARQYVSEFEPGEGRLFFQGSWGFQRYMELSGAERLAVGSTELVPGDRVVIAMDNTNVFPLPPLRSKLITGSSHHGSEWISLMSRPRAAGFYASVWGTLPFSFGNTQPERYGVFAMTRSWTPERLER